MKKIILLLTFLTGFASLKADEGMWLLMLLNKNIETMQNMGLKLSAEDIYSVNQHSMKDGIVQFGGGCTGELVSPDGLLLTNHHCGYGWVQGLSSEQNNILKNGFWAKSQEEELACENLGVKFLVRMEEVTSIMLTGLTENMSEQQRRDSLNARTSKLQKQYAQDGRYEVRIANMFNGNAFYMFIYEEFTDVRLVGVPPASLGKYGGDTDNWMWPRHTADFSLFRIYTAPDGSPAAYSKDNIPLKSKFYFPVSAAGVQENDFAMIMGFPGRTDRYLSSHGVKMALEEKNPTIVKVRDYQLDIIKKFRQADAKIDLQYAAKMAGTSNYWKYYIGQTQQLINNHVYDEKVALENEFQNWVRKTGKQAEYGTVLEDMAAAYQKKSALEKYNQLYIESIRRGPEIFQLAFQYQRLYHLLQAQEKSKKGKIAIDSSITAEYENGLKQLRLNVEKFFKNYNVNLDMAMTGKMLELFYEGTLPNQRSDVFNKSVKTFSGNFAELTKDLFQKTMFKDEKAVLNFLNQPVAEKLEKDPAFAWSKAIYEIFYENMKTLTDADEKLEKANRLFVKGLLEMNPKKMYYPNANSTIRLSYGKVKGYEPQDGVEYKIHTTLDGTVKKYKPQDREFDLPQRILDLYAQKDFGNYTENGKIIACFLTDNDITGGNSGSPVINGKGELIGCAFDGNWEAMSGDIYFDPVFKRTICVDTRYILFIIDKFANAQNIIQELKIAR